MAYTPSTLTIDTWASPIAVVGTDFITELDETFNSIVTGDTDSLVNFTNTELAKLPTYLSTELISMHAESILEVWNAEAETLTAESYAVEAEDVFVNTFVSDGDGTFTATATTDYSALHHAAKAAIYDASTKVSKTGDTMTGALNVPAGATTTQVPQIQEVVQLSGDTMTGNLEVPTLTIDGNYISPFSFRNKLINGGFNVWQRGESRVGISSDSFAADRWYTYAGTQHPTYYKVDDALRAEYTAVGTTGSMAIYQIIEDGYLELNGQDVTISCKVKTNISNGVAIRIDGVNGTDIAAGDETWHTITETFNRADLDATSYFGVRSVTSPLVNGSYYEVKEIQLELGTVATPFERRPIALEFSMCKRYYRRSDVGTRVAEYTYEMRDTPTVSGSAAPYSYDAELPLV